MGSGEIRPRGERPIEMGRRVGEISTLAQQRAQQVMRVGMQRIDFERVAVVIFRDGALTGLLTAIPPLQQVVDGAARGFRRTRRARRKQARN